MPAPAKWMWVIGGPNGAGKTTVASPFFTKKYPEIPRLNADDRTIELRRQFPDKPQGELNLMAAQQIDVEVDQHIEAGKSFYVETVLSTSKYRAPVIRAKGRGFRFGLLYVSIFPPTLSPFRVSLRVAKGGHAVKPETAIARYERSHKQLRWFGRQADELVIFDNSNQDGKPILIAYKEAGKRLVHVAKNVNPAADRAIAGIRKKKYLEQHL
ncbi:MAG: zeta toxin family protein [Bdellovibrionales bacterium]